MSEYVPIAKAFSITQKSSFNLTKTMYENRIKFSICDQEITGGSKKMNEKKKLNLIWWSWCSKQEITGEWEWIS